MTSYSRRRFLVVGGSLVLAGPSILAACGSDESDGGRASRVGLALLPFFQSGTIATGTQRLAIGVGDRDAILTADELPSELQVQFLKDGDEVGPPVTAPLHSKGLPRPYFPFHTSFTEPGAYDAVARIDGQEATLTFELVPPERVAIPQAGDALIPVDTPTTDDHRGVEPICTRQPECSLHDVTLTEALGEGRPVALLIATPAYCQTAACGPVLDVVLTAGGAYADRVRLVHAEVYTDGTIATPAPVVSTYQLTFEPCLFLADASGTIVERLDVLFDEVEVAASLERLVSA